MVGQNLAVTRGSVKIITKGSSSFTNGTASVSLGQPIESEIEFGKVVNNTSDADIAVQEAVNVASIFMGQGTNRSRNFIVQANAGKYKEASTKALKDANSSLTSALK